MTPETAHMSPPGLNTLQIFELLQSLKETFLQINLVTNVSLENLILNLLLVIARAPDVGGGGAEVEPDDLPPSLQGEARPRPDSLLVTAAPRDRISLIVADNSV